MSSKVVIRGFCLTALIFSSWKISRSWDAACDNVMRMRCSPFARLSRDALRESLIWLPKLFSWKQVAHCCVTTGVAVCGSVVIILFAPGSQNSTRARKPLPRIWSPVRVKNLSNITGWVSISIVRRESFTRNPGLDARSTVTGCPLHNVLYSADLRSKRLSRIVPPSSDSNRREGDWLSFKAIPSGVASFTMRTCCTGGTGLFAIHFSSAARAAAAFSGDLSISFLYLRSRMCFSVVHISIMRS